jgi:hypothetical protein
MIIVILPSRNEAANIGSITKIIDIGLNTYYPGFKSLILNIDSSSSDNTVSIFESINTETPKKSIVLDKKRIGKGFNLNAGIEYGLRNGFKYFLTIDSDVTSIEPSWITLYVEQLMLFSNDFVVPVYKRNRYEGNTTNHFSSPLFYACFGRDIQQPIAGDFAFSESLAKQIMNAFEIDSDYGYGVDTLITWTALVTSSRFSQIHLDNKIHNPSFPKIADIFSEVCLSTFYRINKFRETIKTNLFSIHYPIPELHQNLDLDYCLRPNIKQIERINHLLISLKSDSSEATLYSSDNYARETKDWTKKTSQYVLFLLQNNDLSLNDIIKVRDGFLPLFLSQVVSYFHWLDHTNSGYESNYHWIEQKQELLHFLKLNLSSN